MLIRTIKATSTIVIVGTLISSNALLAKILSAYLLKSRPRIVERGKIQSCPGFYFLKSHIYLRTFAQHHENDSQFNIILAAFISRWKDWSSRRF